MSESFFIGFNEHGTPISILPFVDKNTGYVKGLYFEVGAVYVTFTLPQYLIDFCNRWYLDTWGKDYDRASRREIRINKFIRNELSKFGIGGITNGEINIEIKFDSYRPSKRYDKYKEHFRHISGKYYGVTEDGKEEEIENPYQYNRLFTWRVRKSDMTSIIECPFCGAKRHDKMKGR